MPQRPRQYRHRNRQVPCDKCRRQKVKCRMDGQPPCQRCRHNPTSCTFTNGDDLVSLRNVTPTALGPDSSPPISLTTSPTNTPAAETPSHVIPPSEPATHYSSYHATPSATVNGPLPEHEQWSFDNTALDQLFPTQSISTQISQSLDQLDGHHYQLCGGSSDQDPWLLRHCKFDEFGFRKFFKAHIRNPGGVPTRDKIPTHFIVSEDTIYQEARLETRTFDTVASLRDELMSLIPANHGARLIRLFMKRVFPVLPVVSRTQLGLTSSETIPEPGIIDTIPTHLLAAMYAIAIPFAHEDDHLCLLNAYERPPAARIWKMAYLLIMDAIHTPKLSVVQASLLYLHKNMNNSIVDTAFTWSFMGTVVGLAHSLGLHLQCSLFGLPAQEKRLRRRLWWAVYIEDKWASMLFGRPPYIRSTEWDVVELSADDFVIGSRPRGMPDTVKLPFQDMAGLAVICESVQEQLYSLRQSQNLAEDLAASIATAKPLFHKLSHWRESLPKDITQLDQTSWDGRRLRYPATVYFAYLTLVACIWRAVLRATVRSSEPAQIIDINDLAEPCSMSMEEFTPDLTPYPEMNFQIAQDNQDNSTLIQELYEASLNCASTITDFSASMAMPALSEFWHSWSRRSFALVSNFLILLLIQAPDFTKATMAKQLLQRWRETLEAQRTAFPISSLAHIRLSSYYSVGLAEMFQLPPHVEEAIHLN